VHPPPNIFYFDLAWPPAYLTAERVLHVLPAPAEWVPVLARELPGGGAPGTFRRPTEEEVFRAETERRAKALGLQPLVYPPDLPFDSTRAMRAATYAKSIGRVVPFAQAAFRQAFAGGHSLADPDYILIAAAACEMHPAAVLQSLERRSIREQLAAATARAAGAGVTEVPAIRVGELVFTGELALEEASEAMAGSGTGR